MSPEYWPGCRGRARRRIRGDCLPGKSGRSDKYHFMKYIYTSVLACCTSLECCFCLLNTSIGSIPWCSHTSMFDDVNQCRIWRWLINLYHWYFWNWHLTRVFGLIPYIFQIKSWFLTCIFLSERSSEGFVLKAENTNRVPDNLSRKLFSRRRRWRSQENKTTGNQEIWKETLYDEKLEIDKKKS